MDQRLHGLRLTFVRNQGLHVVCALDVQAPMIDNPEYEQIPDVYKLPPLKFVGFELWQARQPIYAYEIHPLIWALYLYLDLGSSTGRLQVLMHAHPTAKRSASRCCVQSLEQ